MQPVLFVTRTLGCGSGEALGVNRNTGGVWGTMRAKIEESWLQILNQVVGNWIGLSFGDVLGEMDYAVGVSEKFEKWPELVPVFKICAECPLKPHNSNKNEYGKFQNWLHVYADKLCARVHTFCKIFGHKIHV